MFDKEYTNVRNFHVRFKVPCAESPTCLAGEQLAFRVNFLQEELDEFAKATQENDLVGAFDALLDLVWVAKGTAEMMGITPRQWTEGWEAVNQANMSKCRAAHAGESKRGTSLDIVKPAGWVGPEETLKVILSEISFSDDAFRK